MIFCEDIRKKAGEAGIRLLKVIFAVDVCVFFPLKRLVRLHLLGQLTVGKADRNQRFDREGVVRIVLQNLKIILFIDQPGQVCIISDFPFVQSAFADNHSRRRSDRIAEIQVPEVFPKKGLVLFSDAAREL